MQLQESLTIETDRLTHSHELRSKQLPFLVLATLILSLSIWADWVNFGRVVIRSDGTGYYEYLPAILKYGDPWLEQIRKRRDHEIDATVACNLVSVGGDRYVIKYPMGVALLWLPFYLIADLSCHFFAGHEATGYSNPYQIAVCAAAIFYLLLGMKLVLLAAKALFVSSHHGIWFRDCFWNEPVSLCDLRCMLLTCLQLFCRNPMDLPARSIFPEADIHSSSHDGSSYRFGVPGQVHQLDRKPFVAGVLAEIKTGGQDFLDETNAGRWHRVRDCLTTVSLLLLGNR